MNSYNYKELLLTNDNKLIKFCEDIKDNFLLELTNNNTKKLLDGWYYKNILDYNKDIYCKLFINYFINTCFDLNNIFDLDNDIKDNFKIIESLLNQNGFETNSSLRITDFIIRIGISTKEKILTDYNIHNENDNSIYDRKMYTVIVYLENNCVEGGNLNLYDFNTENNINCCENDESKIFKLKKSIEINPSGLIKKIVILDGKIYRCPQSIVNGKHISISFSLSYNDIDD